MSCSVAYRWSVGNRSESLWLKLVTSVIHKSATVYKTILYVVSATIYLNGKNYLTFSIQVTSTQIHTLYCVLVVCCIYYYLLWQTFCNSDHWPWQIGVTYEGRSKSSLPVTGSYEIGTSYFVTFHHILLQLKCTLSSVSPKLWFRCRRIVVLGLPASH